MSALYDAAAFPPLAILADNWRTIRDESLRLDRSEILPVNRIGKSHEQVLQEILECDRPGWVESWGPMQKRWLNYGFCAHGRFLWDTCPATNALLQRLGGIKVAALSLFRPNTHLLPHAHDELRQEGMLTYHLGLELADDFNFLNVAGEFVQECEGKAFVFDGAETHYAFNFSDRDRLILYLEFSPERLALN